MDDVDYQIIIISTINLVLKIIRAFNLEKKREKREKTKYLWIFTMEDAITILKYF